MSDGGGGGGCSAIVEVGVRSRSTTRKPTATPSATISRRRFRSISFVTTAASRITVKLRRRPGRRHPPRTYHDICRATNAIPLKTARRQLHTLVRRLRQGLFSSALILSKPRRRGRTSARSVAMLWTLSVLIRQRARHHSFSLLQKLRPHTRSPGRALPQPLQPRRRSPSALPLPATRSCVKGRRSPSR